MRQLSKTIVAIFAALCTAQVAGAQETRVAVQGFYGPASKPLQTDVASALRKQSSVTVVPRSWVDAAAGALSVDAETPEGRIELARELKLSGWVTGVTRRKGPRLELTLVTYAAATHDRVGRTVLTAKSVPALRAAVRKKVWEKVEEPLLAAAEVAEAADAEEAATESDSVSASTDSKPDEWDSAAIIAAARARGLPSQERNDAAEFDAEAAEAHRTATVVLGIGSPLRSLAYNESLTPGLGDYRMSGAPMVDFMAAYYPGTHLTDDWRSWIGVQGRAQIAIGMNTQDEQGGEFKSKYDAYEGLLRVRVPVAKHHVSAFTGYGMRRFEIEPQGERESPLPNVDYRYLPFGVGGELAMAPTLKVGLDAAWLHLLSVGELAEWFPRTTGGAVQLAANLTYGLTDRFFMRGIASYQRMFFDFRSRPDDVNSAGGAVDQYLTMSLGAGVRL